MGRVRISHLAGAGVLIALFALFLKPASATPVRLDARISDVFGFQYDLDANGFLQFSVVVCFLAIAPLRIRINLAYKIFVDGVERSVSKNDFSLFPGTNVCFTLEFLNTLDLDPSVKHDIKVEIINDPDNPSNWVNVTEEEVERLPLINSYGETFQTPIIV